MADPCRKEEILAEMKIEHDKLKEHVTERMHDGDLKFQQIMDAIEEHGDFKNVMKEFNRRMFIDNGTKSIQTSVLTNSKEIALVKEAIKWQVRISSSILVGMILAIVGVVIKHIVGA